MFDDIEHLLEHFRWQNGFTFFKVLATVELEPNADFGVRRLEEDAFFRNGGLNVLQDGLNVFGGNDGSRKFEGLGEFFAFAGNFHEKSGDMVE